ncbi:MAG: hypothetical protein E7185_02445 [Erysipelotrichaceae bacterium]|nr:hypothetical protein [Erysipelotrichaceae bacterium]
MMKNLLRKMTILLSVFLLVLSGFVTVRAEDGEEQADDGTIDLTAVYYVLTTQKDNSVTVPFNTSWFENSALFYNHNLAKASLGLAVASFRPSGKYSDPNRAADESAISFLSQAGFQDMQSDDYDKNPSIYTVSTVMGHQKVGEGDDAFELIAIGVCGQGYLDEWESNFTIVGDNYDNYTVHEGFERSSRLIYDRIFGYIASHHITGPIKVWITGFSRAAAVSNVTAKWLCDSDTFSEETVFAYTFATPRTTILPEDGKYMNIYNIIGKNDPVPMIPFADWGYERYGVTLDTPSIETDSDFNEKRIKANEIYKEITGIDFWVNPQMDRQVRNILDYILKLCPTVLDYRTSLQDQLIHLWADRSPINVLSRVLDIANDPVLTRKETRYEANGFMDYMTWMIIDAATKRNSFEQRYNRKVSIGTNMAQAHTPELYISWVFSADDPLELYSSSDTFSYVMISGNVDVELIRDGEVVESIADTDLTEKQENIYLMRPEELVTAQIPNDCKWLLRVTATEDTDSMLVNSKYDIYHQSPDSTKLYYYEANAGDVLEFTLDTDGVMTPLQEENSSQEYFFESDEYINNTDLISEERSYSFLNLPWRTTFIIAITAFIVVSSLLLYMIGTVVARFRFHHLVKRGLVRSGVKYSGLPMFLTFCVFQLFLTEEFFNELFPGSDAVVIIFKTLIDLIVVALATIAYQRRKNTLNRSIQFGIILLMCADIFIRINFMYGAAIHTIAYLYFAYSFFKEEKPVTSQFVIWGVLSIASIAIILNQAAEPFGSKIYEIVYFISALLMVCASFPLPRKCLAGSALLLIAGGLTLAVYVIGSSFLLHVLSLGTYYAGITTLASTGFRIPMARLVPDYGEDDNSIDENVLLS